jgi:hypothetical protein
MTITVASGTSTPTSTTVIEVGRIGHVDPDLDDRRRDQKIEFAAGETGHCAVFVGRLHAPVHKADAAGEERRQRLVPLLDGGEIGRFALLDHRADPVDFGLSRQGAADCRYDVLDALERHRPRIDRMPSRRLFRKARDVEIAVRGHHQSARDRGRAHQQGIGLAALRVKAQALLDAEAVLLVDDDESEVAELDIRL